tara:strand:- start:566 stop:1951 length:1386 start_codon:yes stop_codon:yes gene_type:complete
MATHDYVIDNSTGANVRTDINNALAAIVSNNSSSSQPSTRYAYMWWADTSAGILKIRNSANDGWVELLQLDGTLTLEDGSASAPGLALRDDLNTGLFSPAADALAITTAGSERIRVASAGQIGIGGANYGSSGQVLTSQGSSSAVQWATVTGTTINSNAADRVIVGSDSANTLTGRSDFTFNGATTTITNSSGLNLLNLKGAASGGLGAQIKLQNTNNANNGTTNISFVDAGGNTYASVQGTNLTDASNNGFLTFFTASATAGLTERAKLTDAGHFEVSDGNLVIGTDGHGIDFSAQTAASSSYTKDSELLDHYEEGTFTPSVSSPQLNSMQNAAFTDASYAQRNGNYIKIGRLVMFVLEIQMASSTSLNGVTGEQVNGINGAFPFARANSSRPIHSPCSIRFTGSTYDNHRIYADARNDFPANYVRITESEGSGLGTLTINEAFPASSHVSISGFYLADA